MIPGRGETTGEPFVLVDDAGNELSIDRPDFDALLVGTDSLANQIVTLCGDNAQEFLDMVGDEDLAVVYAVLDDIRAHWGLTGIERIRWLLDRYYDPIEVDLLEHGINPAGLWTGTVSPRLVLNAIDHLPRTSRYQHVLTQDDDLVAGLINRPEGQPPAAPPLTEFGPEVEALAGLFDRVGELINTVIGVNGGKPRAAKPYPRPVTAADRVRAQRRRESQDATTALLFPPAQANNTTDPERS